MTQGIIIYYTLLKNNSKRYKKIADTLEAPAITKILYYKLNFTVYSKYI